MFTLTQLAVAIALTAAAAVGFTLLVLWHMRDAARHDRDLATRERLQARSLRTIAGAVYATSMRPYAPPAALYDEDETADDYEDDDYPHLKRRADDDTDRDATEYEPRRYRELDEPATDPAEDLRWRRSNLHAGTEALTSYVDEHGPLVEWQPSTVLDADLAAAHASHVAAGKSWPDLADWRTAKLDCPDVERTDLEPSLVARWESLVRAMTTPTGPFAVAYAKVASQPGSLEQSPSADVPKPSWSQMYEAAQRSKAGAR